MKQRLLQLVARIDALSLRERGMLFAAVAAVMVFAANTLALGPLYRTQDALREQIGQQRNNMQGIDGEIATKVQAYQVDPDAPVRARLEAVRKETAQLGDSLLAMEHGLVAPERMAPLVEGILRANGRLKLVAMRSLPVEALGAGETGNAPPPAAAAPTTDAAAPVAPGGANLAKVFPVAAQSAPPTPQAGTTPAKPADLLYRHGVEVTVRGSYPDMVEYMSALEAMPTRLFWGKAQLDVEEYPTSRLTLTLYTLSLDRKWMKL